LLGVWEDQQITKLKHFSIFGTKIIFDLEGKEGNSFSWGLGRSTNNQVEALALFLGLRLIDARIHKRIIVIGNLELIIKILRKGFGQSQSRLSRTILKIIKRGSKI
jgi:ribonuclease HI